MTSSVQGTPELSQVVWLVNFFAALLRPWTKLLFPLGLLIVGPVSNQRQLDNLTRMIAEAHLDGARLFNAIVKLNMDERSAVSGFDSVSVCLSKGLGAPVGSVLLGSRELIDRALRWRKALGGGMRQAGVLAAACLYALEHNVERLGEDHANAAFFADGLRDLGLHVTPPQTNIFYVDVPVRHVQPLAEHLSSRGIRASISTHTRLVTHLDVPRAKIDTALRAFREYPDWSP